MDTLIVSVTAPVASFRRPMDHTYQQTFPVPPPTTLLGLAGAALGLNEQHLWDKDGIWRYLRVSALSLHPTGRMKDLWTVYKIKNRRLVEHSPYFRELLYNVHGVLLYSGEADLLDRLQEGFLNPVYPLSLGREDELLLVQSVTREDIQPLEPSVARFRGTAVPGSPADVLHRVVLREGLRVPIPIVDRVPLRFLPQKDGSRLPSAFREMTFLPPDLEVELQGVSPLFQFRGYAFTWFNA